MADVATSQPGVLKRVKLALDSLTVYRELLKNRVMARLYALVDYLYQAEGKGFDASSFINLYSDFYHTLIAASGSCLGDYLIELLLFEDNPFAVCLAAGKQSQARRLLQAVARDLDSLQLAAGLSPREVKDEAIKYCKNGLESQTILALPEWIRFAGRDEETSPCTTAVAAMGELFRSSEQWSACTASLTDFYRKHGCGAFARYRAFSWERLGKSGRLKGIANPDPITLEDLIGYENQRSRLMENTLHFLKGYPANNVLLYGDRGTGKSSTVKALLNEYHDRGLRMIELPKEYLGDLPEVLRSLKGSNLKFIIFIDDLAFEDSAENYTSLKAVLEGGLESRPANVLIYATSNRRHLIKERFSERAGLAYGGSDDEVRANDTLQEKLSLADRFGITVIFTSPDQEEYLAIVEGIAARRRLRIDREQLRHEALKWARLYNGCSPRTARQFLDWLEGHLKMEVAATPRPD